MEKKYRLLIIDDERANIKTLTRLLHDDYKIMAAKSGDQAIRALQEKSLPDLILLDIMMPGIDGYEVCKKIKQDKKTRDIPVIFITAVTEAEDAARGFGAGAVDFITKPLDPVMVKARVALHLKLYQAMTDLKDALSEVKKMSGLLPICMHCKKIRDDKGYWNQIEDYISHRSEARFSHSLCKKCAETYYPELNIYEESGPS